MKFDNLIRNFDVAKNISNDICNKYQIKSQREWKKWQINNKWCNLPNDPYHFYFEEWINWQDWIGIDKKSNIKINSDFLPFKQARDYVRSLKMKSTIEWKIWLDSKPKNIPSLPYITYKDEWTSWLDWLGYDRINHKSYAIRYISSILDKNKINYTLEKRFFDCRNILPLPFDIYLTDLNVLIEYDGEQHFKSVKIYGSEKSFEKIQKSDIIKNEYCISNLITLIRISYKDVKSILGILQENLNLNLIDAKPVDIIINRKPFLSYIESVKYIRDNLNNRTFVSYKEWIKSNNIDFLPLDPRNFYKENFTSMNDYLSNKYLTYYEIKLLNFKFNFKTKKQWIEYQNDNPNIQIPKYPDKVYKEVWTNWKKFLNKNN